MTTQVLKPLAIALLLGITPLSISTAYAVAAVPGPAGPAGPAGAKGDTGLPGPAGAKGTNGTNGATGATGLAGAAGAKGINGTNGATGAIGPSGGVKGDAGAAGAAGVKGDTGLTGLTGPAGSNGTAGVKGDTGAAGAQGPIGLTGPAGAAGTGSAGGSAAVHVIGDSYAGGIVFWVDADGEHGLIAARADQSTGVLWYNGTAKLTGTMGDGLYAGTMNTALIIAQQIGDNQTGNFAAKVAADYSVQDNGITACTGAATEICYGDWYLPSRFELNLLYLQKVAGVVGGFANKLYWSSSEYNYNIALDQNFSNGNQSMAYKVESYPVRAVRAF
jgi:hypothetical protein